MCHHDMQRRICSFHNYFLFIIFVSIYKITFIKSEIAMQINSLHEIYIILSGLMGLKNGLNYIIQFDLKDRAVSLNHFELFLSQQNGLIGYLTSSS